MKRSDISRVVGGISDKYIEEAAEPTKIAGPAGGRRAAVAACFAVIIMATAAVLPKFVHTGALPPDSDVTETDPAVTVPPSREETDPPQQLTDDAVHIILSTIVLNDLSEVLAGAPLWYDPAAYDHLSWNRSDIADYYGKDIVPPYTPDGMTMQLGGRIVAKKGGEIVSDTVEIRYTAESDSWDTPYISVAVSKLGMMRDCIYLLPENKVRSTDIGGIAVTFGYRSMPYGAYDPDTEEPAGHYNMFVAEFTHDGIGYHLVTERMKMEEIVKTVASIIYDKMIVIDR